MALTEKAEALEAYSEQVRDVLSRPPSTAIRWGTGLVVGIVGLLVVLSAIVRYPETLQGSIIITTKPNPRQIVVPRTGRISKLMVADGVLARAGQVLAELENTTHLEQVPHLRTYLEEVNRCLQEPTNTIPLLADNLTFGDLQSEINMIRQQLTIYQRLHQDHYQPARLQILNQEIAYYQQLIRLNQQQESVNKEEFANAEKKYKIDLKLFSEKVYSQAEFLAYENTYLQKKKENETYRKTLIENKLTLAGKEKERLDLIQSYQQQNRAAFDAIRLALQNCDNLLQNWQQTYLLTAPISGKLYWLHSLQAQQQTRVGDTLFTIVADTHQFEGIAIIAAANRGKLKTGQSVQIRLADFPAEEYGMVQGKVNNIALSPDNNLCRVTILVMKPLRTTFGRVLPFRPNLPGSAEIITEDLSLLDRALYGLRKLIRYSTKKEN